MADGNGGATLDTISIRITATARGAANSIDRLTDSLDALRTATSSSFNNLHNISDELSDLSSALSSLRNVTAPINSLARSMGTLNGLDVDNVADSLGRLTTATAGLGSIGNSLGSIREFRSGVNSLLGSMQRLQSADLNGVADRVNEVVRAIRPLTDEMIRAGSGMSNFGQNLRDMVAAARGANNFAQLNQQIGQLDNRMSRASRSSKGFVTTLKKFASLGVVVRVFREIGQALVKMISVSTEYVEAMNLAAVSLGDLANEAREYSSTISEALGIDQGEMLKNMGLFQNLATSFGMANDQAYILSKGMTQLAYDFASFHDLDIEESFLKFQSALAGELEPIRRVGVDISNARLQQELYDLGLRQNISTLGRADKAILTYIAIMKQSTNEMGDMARTITSPANMLRVLGNQATITARQIGNIFIPMLQAILPWAIAVVKVIGQLAGMLASLVGFEMPDFYEGVDTNAFDGMSEGLEGVGDAAAGAAKEVNRLISGFDELNIFQKAQASAGSGVIGGDLLGNIDLSKYQYDMLEGLVPTDDLVDDVKKFLKKLIEPFNNIDLSNALSKFSDFFKAIKEQFSMFDWAGLLESSWNEVVELFSSVANLVAEAVLPIVEALNLPAIAFSGLVTLKDFISLLGDAVRAVTPGLKNFVEIGLKPIAEWVGEKLVDAFATLSDTFKKVSDWFDKMQTKFTDLGTEVGTLTANLWNLLEPVGDHAWETFKDILGEVTDDVLELAEEVVNFAQSVADGANQLWDLCKELGITSSTLNALKGVVTGLGITVKGFWDILKGLVQFISSTFTRDTTKAFEGILTAGQGCFEILEGKIVRLTGEENGRRFMDFYNNYVAPAFKKENWFKLGYNASKKLHEGLDSFTDAIRRLFDNLIPDQSSFNVSTSFNWKNTGSLTGFATGNVATDPTIAVFGEYPGAKSNPEITAPQSTIYETVVAANSEMVGAVYQMANMIVEAIENNSTEISADSRGIFKAVKKEASNYQKAHGVPAF